MAGIVTGDVRFERRKTSWLPYCMYRYGTVYAADLRYNCIHLDGQPRV